MAAELRLAGRLTSLSQHLEQRDCQRQIRGELEGAAVAAAGRGAAPQLVGHVLREADVVDGDKHLWRQRHARMCE